MEKFKQHLIGHKDSIKVALERLNDLSHLTLFAINAEGILLGSITDGDIRRALLKGIGLTDPIEKVINRNFISFKKGKYSVHEINKIRERKIKLIPLLDDSGKILKLINLETQRTVLPIDAVIMAGGEGQRLRPLTELLPKPLLRVGEKPIIEYNIDRLCSYGIENCFITVKYLGNKIIEYFGNGEDKGIRIHYIEETDIPLGTIGSVSLIDHFDHDYVLVMNSDLLTNIDLEDFFIEFERQGADMSVATIPYQVTVPYAVLEMNEELIKGFKEKPTYTYYSNAGIYLIKRKILEKIPKGSSYNATDLMDSLIKDELKLTTYPMYCYWLDIGSPEDFKKAQEDVKHIKF